MRSKRRDQELQGVLKRVLPLVPEDHSVVKAEFEAIHDEILACVHEKTGASAEQLRPLVEKVFRELPNEYGRLDAQERSWPALIRYLYSKYRRELGTGW